MTKPDIIEFITDPQLLGLGLSEAQETLLRAIYALLMSPAQLDLFRLCTGLERPPGTPFGEITVVAGARSGKDSRIAAPIVCYEAVFGGHERHLAKGERGIVALVAQDLKATRVAFGYIRDYLGTPILASMVKDILASEILLTNRLTVSCFPSTMRSMRGWSIPVGVMDELAFYRLEGQADSDVEIQASIRRGMLNFPSPRLVKISTPYMKSGVLHNDFQRAFGKDDPDLLVWRAPSTLMNPTITEARLAREQRLDPQRFAREYLAEFAEDLEAFLPGAWVDEAVVRSRHELPPREEVTYVGAVDPSGGGPDAFTLAVVHVEGPARRVVQDVMKGWVRRGNEQVDLEGIVRQIAETLRRYRIGRVVGDRYSAEWVVQAFRAVGIGYEEAAPKAEVYLEVEPLFAQGRIELLDHPTLVRELKCLERRPRIGGRTIVDHPTGGRDDYATALALAAAKASAHRQKWFEGYGAPATAQGRKPCRMHDRVRCPACEPNWTLQDLLRGGVGSGLWL